MSRKLWNTLLQETRAAFVSHPSLTEFSRFPDDLTPIKVNPHQIPSASLLQAETGLFSDRHGPLRDAFIAASPQAQWRETYKGTKIGQDFMDRFGCYALIGQGGAFQSAALWAWVVYMPPQLHYPWHHHPGEEMYLVLAGEARFMKSGERDKRLREGDTSFHASNQPHAMETRDHPVMCLVVWRNGFETAPVLTEGLA